MVMDATQPQQPSPQSVGREFVRQYYTLLNKAPNHLHRFYNNNSSFIHGESTLVVGQKNIHNRIQQLNFHDCHAKISQVDAQATLGNGVVVQVTGELSNDGQPMRRFTQTFVLAPQSPKKYYVHNDIFRYQDMYSDEEVDGESRSENDEEHEQQQLPPQVQSVTTNSNDQQGQVVSTGSDQQPIAGQVIAGGASGAVLPQQPTQAVYYSMPTAGGRPITVLQPPPGVTAVPIPAANFTNNNASVVPTQQQPVQANASGGGVTQLNGVVAHDEIISSMTQASVAPQQQMANQSTSPVIPQVTGAVPVGSTTVLGAQTPVGVAGVVTVAAAATAGLPQNTSSNTTMPSYQQSPVIQPHILQQQTHPPQAQIPTPIQPQPLPNTPSQQPAQQQTMQQQTQTPLSSTMNVTEIDDNVNSNNTITQAPQAPLEQQSRPNTTANVVASGQTISSSPSTVLEPPPTPAPIVEDFKTINEQQQQEKYEAAKQQQNEPKTYANLLKSSSSSPSSFVNAAMQQQQQIQQQQQQSIGGNSMYANNSNMGSSSYSQSASSTPSISLYGNRNSDNISSVRQDNNNGQNSGVGPLPQRSNAKGFSKDFDQRRSSNIQQFGDNQQLFLGNIPHHASEEELKNLFSQFGSVVDLRILSKGSGKIPPGGRNPLNYGFITYSDPDAVQNCLANCPLYFPDNSPDGQKLNVEEKKPRARTNDMPPRQNMGGGSGMNNMNNNQRNMSSGGPPSRSLSNSGSGGGSMMRGNSVGNNNSMSRGGSSGGGAGTRMGGAFNRNDNRTSNGGSGSQMRGGNNSQTQGNSYSVRR
ncbi:ras GTPase-activating protein-binding protein 2 [Haematobia irritans]|uniref:ras GTPase-activating protein-binding protein 2 n=1 Tax=Haematobia irritans TaxID=7368 RepID=UPI003F4F53D5